MNVLRPHPRPVPAFPLLAIALAAVLILSAPLPARSDDFGPLLKGLTHAEALRLGEIMYRDGILPGGGPLKALVKGDVPVDGTMFSCVSCHLRSGFGAREGQVRTPPVDGTRLYAPILQVRGAPILSGQAETNENLYRPAYTDETLGRVIETGIDSGGKQLDTVMPIYFLNERDRDILVHYLKHLSTQEEPGVTETEIRFATVVAGDVSKADRDAMLVPLQNYIRNWRLPLAMERGMRSQVFRREGMMRPLRKAVLYVWELTGPVTTWRGQLEGYYRKSPVFALLGGISEREWEPVHRFCEENRIPAVFPITDYPVISESDWYTLYLSKGLYQEGEAAARYLHEIRGTTEVLTVVQVYRDAPPGRALAEGFLTTWESLGHPSPRAVILKAGAPLPQELADHLDGKGGTLAALLWLDSLEIPDSPVSPMRHSRQSLVFASSTLLGPRLYAISETVRPYLYVTYPTVLPSTNTSTGAFLQNIPDSGTMTRLKMHCLVQTVSGPLSQIRSFANRENFLEMIESTIDLTASPTAYPRLSFGPGQRYASKGCYIVQLSNGPNPHVIRKSDWVIY